MTADTLVLETKVPVECHVVQADISRASKTPHILPVLMHVRDMDGNATAGSLAAELFAESVPLGRRLLDICRDDGLVEEDRGRHALTEDGRSAVDCGRVFVGEEKMWVIHYSPLPVIPGGRRVLKLEDGRREAGYREGDPEPGPPEGRIEELKHRIMTTSFGDGQEFRINGITGMAKRIGTGMRVTLRLEIGRQGSILRMDAPGSPPKDAGRRGARSGSRESMSFRGPDITYGEALDQLLEQKGVRGWDGESNRLRVPCGQTGRTERNAMSTTLDFEPLLLDTKFDPLKVSVGICPVDRRDAQTWADRMFVDRTRDYLTRGEYGRITAEIGALLPGFGVSFRERGEYVGGTERGTDEFWRIQAAEDWRL